jgi:hypothetical protein
LLWSHRLRLRLTLTGCQTRRPIGFNPRTLFFALATGPTADTVRAHLRVRALAHQRIVQPCLMLRHRYRRRIGRKRLEAVDRVGVVQLRRLV